MTTEARIKEAEQKFENQRRLLAEQDNVIKEAEQSSVGIRTEMAKLQGEHRVLTQLLEEEQAKPKVSIKGESK